MTPPVKPEDLYTLHAMPALASPVLVVHLYGWIDAADAASEAMEVIVKQMDAADDTDDAAVTVAEFDTEWLLDHRAHRPTVRIVEGVNTGLEWPKISLRAGKDSTDNDVVVLTGPEPDMHWRTFSTAVVDLAQQLGVRRVLGLGAYPAAAPHSRPSRLSASAATPELASLGTPPATLDVAAGVQAVLELEMHEAGIEAVGLWAQVPHYISGARYPAASVALVDGLVGTAGLVFDSSELAADALATRTHLDRIVAEDAEHSDMVADLVQEYDDMVDAEAAYVASGDLDDALEALLRDESDGR